MLLLLLLAAAAAAGCWCCGAVPPEHPKSPQPHPRSLGGVWWSCVRACGVFPCGSALSAPSAPLGPSAPSARWRRSRRSRLFAFFRFRKPPEHRNPTRGPLVDFGGVLACFCARFVHFCVRKVSLSARSSKTNPIDALIYTRLYRGISRNAATNRKRSGPYRTATRDVPERSLRIWDLRTCLVAFPSCDAAASRPGGCEHFPCLGHSRMAPAGRAINHSRRAPCRVLSGVAKKTQ